MVRTIKVGLTTPDAGDVIDYTIALIETYGWHQMGRADVPHQESSDAVGYTLHDAIGKACTRLSQAVAPGTSGSKDWTVTSASGVSENLRTTATRLVQQHLPDGENDQTFNDKAKGVDDVLEVLRLAREDVAKVEVAV